MTRHHVIGASAVALCAALGMGQAFAVPAAARTVTAAIADYNAADVKAAGDILTVPTNLATYSIANSPTAGSLEINSRFTVTLPSGFSFASQPSLIAPGATTFTLSSGGIGAQSATYTVGTAAVTGGEKIILDTFSVQGASALETPIPVIGALPITMQSTNNALITNNDPKPLSAKAFASEPGAVAIFVGAIQFIDLASPTLGTLFGDNPAADTSTAVLSAIAINPQPVDAATHSVPVLQANGAPNTLATSDTATVTISGLFNGIATAFASTGSDCSTPITGTTGTATPTQVTFSGVPLAVPEIFFCVTADGTTLLRENPQGFNPTVAPDSATDFLSASVDNEFPGIWTYAGGGIISVTNFFTGTDSGYATLLRVNNAGSSASNIFALVQPDTGGPALSGSLGSIGPGIGTVFSEAQVQAAVTGLDLADSTQRATLQLIVSGVDFPEVKASTFLVSPGGFVANVGTQPNPEE